MMWCRDISEALNAENNRLDGMKEFEQKSFRVNTFTHLMGGEIFYCNYTVAMIFFHFFVM